MNVAVIGANGFLGRNICAKYLDLGCNVFAFYNKNSSNIPFGCKLISVLEFPKVDFDYLFISIGNYSVETSGFLEQIDIIQGLLKKNNYRKVIFISSTAVYGSHLSTINVNGCFNNPSQYGMSKLVQEFFVRSKSSYAIIRPTYIFGDGMNKNSLIPFWIESASKRKKIIVFGNGERRQDYIHIADLTELCTQVAAYEENSIVLATSGKSISNIELATIIKRYYPQTLIEFQGVDNGSSFEFDISDTIEKFNWTPVNSIDLWLSKMVIENESFNL